MHTGIPSRDDVQAVVASLRGIDVLEANLLHFANTPEQIIEKVPKIGTFVVYDFGQPVALYGIVDGGDGVGYPWMVGTDEFSLSRPSVIRDAREIARDLVAPYRTVTNTMLACNTTHRRFVDCLFRPSWDLSLHVSGLQIARFNACVFPQQP
jgi:hypothetical protein